MEHTTPKHPSGMEIRYTNRRTNSTHLGQAVSGGGVHLASPIRDQHLVVPATVRAPLHNHRHLLLLQCVSIVLDGLHHVVVDLQCQVRVGQKRENFNAELLRCLLQYCYSVNGLFSKISGWVVAHTAHP
jgi:hypothetical protein